MENNQQMITEITSPYAPGYRFMPTDEELITEYLTKKVNNDPIPIADICEVNLYEHSPFYLAANFPQLGDNEYYFFTPRDRKYPNGNRPNRAVGNEGYWKATGADKAITTKTGQNIGGKKVLVFYVGKPKPEVATKTDWIMHEFRLNAPSKCPNRKDMRLDDWVLCRIYRKSDRGNKKRKDCEENVKEVVALDNNNNNIGNAIDQQNGGAMMMMTEGGQNQFQQSQPSYFQEGYNQAVPNSNNNNNIGNAVDQQRQDGGAMMMVETGQNDQFQQRKPSYFQEGYNQAVPNCNNNNNIGNAIDQQRQDGGAMVMIETGQNDQFQQSQPSYFQEGYNQAVPNSNNNNNMENAIDQQRQDGGAMVMIERGQNDQFQQSQPSYFQEGYNQAAPNFSHYDPLMLLAGTSEEQHGISFGDFDCGALFNYEPQYQELVWGGDYNNGTLGNQGTGNDAINFQQQFPYAPPDDVDLKKIADDFVRDEKAAGFSKDDAERKK